MSSTDWTDLTGSLSPSSLDRGVTAGITPPPGGGSFIYGYNSLDTSVGTHGKFVNLGSFAPMAKGGIVKGAVQRGPSGGPLNFSPLLFIGAQGPATTDLAYMLGLQDDDPHHIVLRKGQIAGGLPAGAPGTNGILRKSNVSYAVGTWLHLRLDMIVNANGDVLLQCFANDLTAGGASVATPVWVAIPGMDSFTDDALGIASGSAPFTSGRAGWAFVTKDVTRRGFFDHIEIDRQL